MWGRLFVALAALLALAGCQQEVEQVGEEDLGPIEEILDEVTMTVWPGVVDSAGQRYVRLINGFFAGEPTAYWFAGFASKNSPDVFWFCREGDTACPFDDRGVIDRERTVGDPVFAAIPGESDYSPFWLAWVVYVPEDYQPNELKSVYGIEQAAAEGEVLVEPVFYDHGGEIGPREVVMHCLLVLTGTVLEGNGDPLVNDSSQDAAYLPAEKGWFRQYQVEFYDFTPTEGVFAPDDASESTVKMRSSDIFVFFRDCENGSESIVCDYAATSSEIGAVSERGIEEDITGDGDKADNNNIISGFPGAVLEDPLDRPYSPLWKVHVVRIPPEHDDEVVLLDTTGDQNITDIKDPQTMREYVEAGLIDEPMPMTEAQAGNSIPGNDGDVFFNCPSQAAPL